MSATHHDEPSAHRHLEDLRLQLQQIYDSITHFQPLTAKPPILDSSIDLDVGSDDTDDRQWLQQEVVPGLKNLRDAVKRDLDGLEKFLADPDCDSLPALSTNAPYLVAVWNELTNAPSPIVSIFKSVNTTGVVSRTEARRRVTQKPTGVKVDVVADNGRRWIRVNTVKNSRLLAEFREIDSYLTDSEGDSDHFSYDGPPTLAQPEFDNSVLRMGRSLLAAAKTNPLQGTNEIPHVTLRLTRLDLTPIGADGNEIDSRIAKTVQCLGDMGIDVQLGERNASIALPPLPISHPRLEPTTQVNLDLSVIIALVSDLTHAPLPSSIQEANARFIPSQKYREWKVQRMAGNGKKGKLPGAVDGDRGKLSGELSKHTRALANHVLQEMGKGLIQELFDRLSALTSSESHDDPSSSRDNPTTKAFPKVEFWTTPEARDRCLRIVSKIGGENEKRRAHALFSSDSTPETAAAELYWRDSRYPQGLIPLLPIRLHPSSEPPPRSDDSTNLPPFFKSLARTCRDILAEEIMPHPRSLPDDLVTGDHVPDVARTGDRGGEIQRATVTRANPRLTSHTVQTMLWGAELGWTTLTANKSGVKAILRELKAAKVSGRLDHEPDAIGEHGQSECEKAAIWIVDPRSLAEGMRSDGDGEN